MLRLEPPSGRLSKHLPSLPPCPCLAWAQLGAGATWEVDTSYQWRGLKGDWAGFGPSITAQVRASRRQAYSVDVPTVFWG